MKEKYAKVVFTEPGIAMVRQEKTEDLLADSKRTVIQTECSIVSAGTELACLSGRESWAPLPYSPGYGSVGRVLRPGAGSPWREGDRVFTYGPHAEYGTVEAIGLPVGDTLRAEEAVFARIAAVSITSLRVSQPELGDTVAVFGLGLVGNLAAQLFRRSGCRVIGIDPEPKRRAEAEKCGIQNVLAPDGNLEDAVRMQTGGRMCEVVVEATGVPAVAARAAGLAGANGQLVLLGSPRGDFQTNLTEFLNRSHLWDQGCVTIKGAHEWRFPLHENPGAGRHSIERNLRGLLEMISAGELVLKPLTSHVVPPSECQAVYAGLQNHRDEFLGVVFDFRNL